MWCVWCGGGGCYEPRCSYDVELLAFLRHNCEKIVTYWDESGECEGMQLMFYEVDFRAYIARNQRRNEKTTRK